MPKILNEIKSATLTIFYENPQRQVTGHGSVFKKQDFRSQNILELQLTFISPVL